MRKKIIALTTVMILGVSSMAFNSFATNQNQNKQHGQMKERPERQKKEVFGKITAISESSVTISVAERKKPEDLKQGLGTLPEKPANENANNGDNASGNNNNDITKEPPKQLTEEQIAEMKKNLENMFTLTGETKTIDISSAKFDDFGRGPRDGKKGNQNNSNNNQKTEKTYKDYQVGDYISIELENETSTKAKSVRSAFMMRGGMPRGDRGQGKGNGANNSNNANNANN